MKLIVKEGLVVEFDSFDDLPMIAKLIGKQNAKAPKADKPRASKKYGNKRWTNEDIQIVRENMQLTHRQLNKYLSAPRSRQAVAMIKHRISQNEK